MCKKERAKLALSWHTNCETARLGLKEYTPNAGYREPPFLPASFARVGLCLKLPPLAFPPLLAIARCFSLLIDANPRLLVPVAPETVLTMITSCVFAAFLAYIGRRQTDYENSNNEYKSPVSFIVATQHA